MIALALFLCSIGELRGQAVYQHLFSFAMTNTSGEKGTGTLIEGNDGALYGLANGGGAAGYGTVFRLDKETGTCSVLHSFQGQGEGSDPSGGLLEGADGALYGATSLGGLSSSQGVVFRLNKDGTGYTLLHSFGADPDDGPDFPGSFPLGSLIEAGDTFLYGATEMGGAHLQGTLFRIRKDGSGYQVIHTFTGAASDGGSPSSPLIQGNDEKLYGVARNVVFRAATDGSEHEVLHTFSENGTEGRSPNALIQASDGVLYGTTQSGTPNGGGTIFKLNSDGTGFAVLRGLSQADGTGPTGGLIEATNGSLRGMVGSGGPAGGGNLFVISTDGSYYSPDLVFGYSLAELGYFPVGGLLQGSDGYFYGTTSTGGANAQGTVFSTRRAAFVHTILWHFERTDLNGSEPRAPLMQASDGRLYGTTSRGGVSHLGTIFSLNADGSDFRVLWHATTSPNANGTSPKAPLIEGIDGRLYGTTAGSRSFSGPYFGGTVYGINKDGTDYRLLSRFAGAPADGESPESALVQCEDGRLYGTTRNGGASTNGTIFRLNTDGSGYSQLRTFNGTNGANPNGLTKGSDGILYGTTWRGGALDLGTVFKVKTDGSGFAVLRHFQNDDSDVQHPESSLLEGTDGGLYGTAYQSGTNVAGAIFRLNKDGSDFKILWRFGSFPEDGWEPAGALVEGADAVLYGATAWGGRDGYGTVFRLHKDGSVYHVVCDLPSLTATWGTLGVIAGFNGGLYGITCQADFAYGTIYQVEVPTVLFNPAHSGNRFSFQFNAHPTRVYLPQFKNDPSASEWTFLPSILGVQGFVMVTDTNLTSNSRIYRVVGQ